MQGKGGERRDGEKGESKDRKRKKGVEKRYSREDGWRRERRRRRRREKRGKSANNLVECR